MPELGYERLPYPGLRPFEADEADLFFGREQQVDGLLKRLSNSHFVAVVGESGAGKSSLVRAGLLPALEAGFVVEAGSDWRVAVMRPGGDPLTALADVLLGPHVLTEAGGLPRREFALAELRRGPLGLVQLVSDARLPASCNLLLVVDQFEELFRYCREPAQKDQASIFVELLLQASQQRQVSISVVLTMRSDFVGDCARFRGLPERLNDNQFLTPRLTRDQIAEAIRGPARVGGGVVDAALVDELCNAVGDNQDQLPLLQHLLMRVWERASKESNPPRLTPELSRAMGGLYSALSNHAEQIYDSLLGESARPIARAMFKSLTDPFSRRRDVRRDASVSEIAAIADAAPQAVIAVANEFRAPGRHMLMPPPAVPLDPDSRLDISHESLIRQWSKLSEWAAEEAANAHEFVRLRDEALRDLKDRELLTGRSLSRALDWKKQARPTAGWAVRYAAAGALDATLAYIEESEKKEEEKKAEELRAIQREAVAKRHKVYNVALAILLVMGLALAGWAVHSANQLTVATKTLAEHERRDHEHEQKDKEQQLNDQKARLSQATTETAQERTQRLAAEGARRLASSQRGAADAMLELPNDPALAVLLANRAVTESPGEERVSQALRAALAAYVPNDALPFGVPKKKNYVPGSNKETFLLSGLSPSSVSSLRNMAVIPFRKEVTILSTATGKHIRTWPISQSKLVGSAIFSPDGRLAVTTGDDGVARVWNTSTFALVTEKLTHKAAVNGAAFSRDGRMLVTLSDDHHAKVWVVGSYMLRCDLSKEKEREEFISASFSLDQHDLVTLTHNDGDWRARVWNIGNDRCSEVEDKNLDAMIKDLHVVSASFSANSAYLGLVTDKGVVKMLSRGETGWTAEPDFVPGQEYPPPASRELPAPPPLAWSGDGKYFAAAGADNIVRVAEMPTSGTPAAPRAELRGHTGRVTSISFHPKDNRLLLTTSADHTARLWKLTADQRSVLETVVLRGHTDTVHSGVFSADGDAMITASDDTTLRLWKPALSFRELSSEDQSVGAASFSADGQRIWVADSSTVSGFLTATLRTVTKTPFKSWAEFYKTVEPQNIAYTRELASLIKWPGLDNQNFRLRTREKAISSISPNGRFVVNDTAGSDSVKVWAGGQTMPGIARPKEYRAVGVSNDGAQVAWYSANKNGIVITRKGKPDLSYVIEVEKIVESVRFSGDGRKLAVTLEDYSVKVLDLEGDPERQSTMRGHTGRVENINFSPDDRFLVSVSADATLRIWDVASGKEIVMAPLPDESFNAVSFSPDGLSLLLASPRRLLLWQCRACGSTNRLLDTVRQTKIRDFSNDEKRRYGFEETRSPS